MRPRRPRRADAARARGRRPVRPAPRGGDDALALGRGARGATTPSTTTVGTDADARGPAYFWIGPEERGEPPGAARGYDGAGAAGSGRRWPTRPGTGTGWSRRSWTSTRPTRRASWCWPRPASDRCPTTASPIVRKDQIRPPDGVSSCRSVNREVAESLACCGRDIPHAPATTSPGAGGARTSRLYPPGARCSPSVAAPRPPRRLPNEPCPDGASPARPADKAAARTSAPPSGPPRPPRRPPRRSPGKVGKADRLAAARAPRPARQADEVPRASACSRAVSKKQPTARWDKPVYAPGEEPSSWDVSEWSLRRKVALVLAVPVIVAAVFGGLRINTERQLADNYAASASQVSVLGPAVDYLAAAQRAAAIARAVGINDPKLDEAQQEVVEAGTKLVEARDRAELTPTQLRQVNDVISLSEQMRTGMAYVSITSSVSQVRQLERGITQIISHDRRRADPARAGAAGPRPGPRRPALAVAAGDPGRQQQDDPPNPGRALPRVRCRARPRSTGSPSRWARPTPACSEIRQSNAQRMVNAARRQHQGRRGKLRGVRRPDRRPADRDRHNLARAARNAKVLTWVDSIIIGLALLAAIILALLVSRLILNPIRRVRSGALEVAHERLPEAVAKIRAGEDPGEIVPIGVTTHEETGQLARAVDDLHRQAVKLASNEAFLREQVGDMFVTLSRRNTSLINQQLSLIETLESDEEDPQRLESLFRLDHLASRMRRNAESLVILSGAPDAGHRAGRPVADRRPPGRHRRCAGLQAGPARRRARPAGQRRGRRRRGAPAGRARGQRAVVLAAELTRARHLVLHAWRCRGPGDRRRSRHRRGRPGRAQREASCRWRGQRPTPLAGWACSWSAGSLCVTA